MKKDAYERLMTLLIALLVLEGLLLAGLVVLFSFVLSTLAAVGWGQWSALAWGVFIFAMLFTLLRFVAAFGLWKRTRWGRLLAAVVGIIGIFSFPIGTIIGALSVWLLLVEEKAKTYFGQG